ncbi:MAG: DUF6516 family protein [Desulfurococcales archaeon]|nr:DUF6516 family protein [Desulfurococcales archaeon]
MANKILERISYITDLMRGKGLSVSLLVYRSDEAHSIGYYRLLGLIDDCKVYIMEFISDKGLVKYSYTLLLRDIVMVRYDNAPHHPNITTHPHHKHIMGRIEPLEDSSIEKFLEEIENLVSENCSK